MPWKETHVMDEKIRMIGSYLSGEYTLSELSRIHGVSRKTLYKWTHRYEADRETGLLERPRRPIRMPRATPPETVGRILSLKDTHTNWGARKLTLWLKKNEPEEHWPALSTVSELLRRHGLTHPRQRRRHTPPYAEAFLASTQPNEVWCADYKGQFHLGSGPLCYPLTLTDHFSRYLLDCRGLLHPAYQPTRERFERAFREYGLPLSIRTDNGTPFASSSLGGLSRLSVWFVRLGIRPERIEKGHPEQNGRHERFHRTLKLETIRPPRHTLSRQQEAFDRFRAVYNSERPHEALGDEVPASYYRPSTREYPRKLPPVEYPSLYEVRLVKENGCIKWKNVELYLGGVLGGEFIGLKEVDDGLIELFLSFYRLGVLDERTFRIRPCEKV